MCGIVGLWDTRHNLTGETAEAVIRHMAGTLAHRGPDDEGYFAEPTTGLMLGFRRLSIVDLSREGHQPMTSASGRYVIVFNGEVYNHTRLRPELEAAGFGFRGHSDTEVMLAAIEHWGLEPALKRFVGMFAIGLWDKRDQVLTLVRDRLGIKPLYFGWVGGLFVFASELHAIKRLHGFANDVDRNALTLFLRYNYIPEPYSIFKGLYKLMPGTLLRVDRELAAKLTDIASVLGRATPFWDARAMAEDGVRRPWQLSDVEATEELDRILRDAVSLRMRADVPLGAFLSGGIDSSTVAALMQAQSRRPVKTFSIGFERESYNEAEYARAVASHLGTEHHELTVTTRDLLNVVPQLSSMYDEPFADPSQIPTFLVSKLAREHVTVSLSGDGGDELFGGYNRYVIARRLRQMLRFIPESVVCGAAGVIGSNERLGGSILELANRLAPRAWRFQNPATKVSTLVRFLKARDDAERYRVLVSHWRDPEAVVLHGSDSVSGAIDATLGPSLGDPIADMMYADLVTYLPGSILTKLDRASMHVSLEARVPLLDHRVVEFAWRIPMSQKLREGQGKWLLRQVLSRYLPMKLFDRPKQGFGGPLGDWLRGPLYEWAETLLGDEQLRKGGYFNVHRIRAEWRDHLSGRADNSFRMWSVLMFQAWLDQRSGAPAIPIGDQIGN